jgi:hypothetical protein
MWRWVTLLAKPGLLFFLRFLSVLPSLCPSLFCSSTTQHEPICSNCWSGRVRLLDGCSSFEERALLFCELPPSHVYMSTADRLLQITIIDRAEILPAEDAASTDISKVVRYDYSDQVYSRLAKEAIARWKQDFPSVYQE